MAITVTMPINGPFSIEDIVGSIDAIIFDFTLTGGSSSQFTGAGLYKGAAASYVVSGSGFGLSPGGDIIAGIISSIQFTTGGQTLSFTNVNINMAALAPAIAADDSGADPSAVEDFLQALDWDLTLANNADIAPVGSLIGDNVPFNLMGDDIIHAKGGNDNLFSGDGNDRVWGDDGNDILNTGAGNDRVWGGKGDDRMIAGAGNDTIYFGGGRDYAVGGSGADDFVFNNQNGVSRIKDFNASNNAEDIDLKAVSAITGFVDLRNNHMTQSGTSVVIDDGAGTRIILLNTDLGDLGAGDFLF